MSDVSEQAKALAEAMWWSGGGGWVPAQRAIDDGWVQRDTLMAELEAQGWTPPSDPWEPIARYWCIELWGDESGPHYQRTLAAVRDLLPDEDEARAIAGRIEEAAA